MTKKKKYKVRDVDQMADDLDDGLENINDGMVTKKRRRKMRGQKYKL